MNAPFLLGVLLYYVRERGHVWRWHVAGGLGVYLATVPGRFESLESIWVAYSFPAVALIWVALHLRQLPRENRFVLLGEYTYGVYLLHAPLIMGTFAVLKSSDWIVGSTTGVVLAGLVALLGGLAFGRVEFAIHRELKGVSWNGFTMRLERSLIHFGSLPRKLLSRVVSHR